MRVFQVERKFLFYSIFHKKVPLTKDPIFSTTFNETYWSCANLNRENLKLSENV